MLDPSGLFAVARSLAEFRDRAPGDAEFRRAVSTAYYAVFHTLLLSGAQRFFGEGAEKTAGYGLIYRGFEHQRLRMACEALRVSPMPKRFRDALGRTAVSQDMRDFAVLFQVLQDRRHSADYDPVATFEQSDVESVLDSAEAAIEAFTRASAEEKADVLALFLVGARA